jgi:hypothetical protein
MATQKTSNDLASLQKRLNDDPKLVDKFLKDPVKTLKGEGLSLTPEMAKDLKNMVSASKTPKDKLGTALRTRIIIKIGIGVAAS